MADPSKVDRLPPHSIEAEQGVLGCILLEPGNSLNICVTKLKHAHIEAFYDLRHRVLYEVMVDMYTKKEAIDLITFGHRLKDRQQLEAVGGLIYISSLPDSTPSAANLEYYLGILLDHYRSRKVLHACTEAVGHIYDDSSQTEKIILETAHELDQLRQAQAETQIQSAKDLIHKSIQTIERMYERKLTSGIATGFVDLDKMTGGLQNKDFIIIAARPSVGKTSLAMNIAEYVAADLKKPVGVFSLEMPAETLMLRMLCSRARVNLRQIQDGFMSDHDFPKLTGAAGKLANSPIYIDDSSSLSTLELKAKARQMKEMYGIELFVIDYLQLMHSSKPRMKRSEEVSDISGAAKAVAKDLNVPVIGLSQLDRGTEREKRAPRLSDLRESGSLEQDGDLIVLLDVPKSENGDDRFETDSVNVNADVAKQRNGPTGMVLLTFFKRWTRFESAARIAEQEDPNLFQPKDSDCPPPEAEYNRDEQ